MPMDNPVFATRKVTLTNRRNPTDSIEALINPDQLNPTTEAVIGELNPVGSSSSVHMYGHTKSTVFSLMLRFSSVIHSVTESGWGKNTKPPITGIERAINWLNAYVYGPSVGIAPAPIIVFWPNVLHMVCIVKTISNSITRFDNDLKMRMAEVTVNFENSTRSHITSGDVTSNGWIQNVDAQTKSSFGTDPNLGAPLNIGRRNG